MRKQRINREKLLKEISAELNLRVSRDDPVVAMIVGHDLILDAYDEILGDRIDTFIVEQRLLLGSFSFLLIGFAVFQWFLFS